MVAINYHFKLPKVKTLVCLIFMMAFQMHLSLWKIQTFRTACYYAVTEVS